ncbi:MAG: hypothetical protein WD673_12520, partial [Alphaproteobacteria bacterium]
MTITLTRREAFLMVAFAFGAPTPAWASEAGDFVQKLGDDALELLVRTAGGEAEQAERLRFLLTSNFDLRTIGRAVLGPNWKAADEAQRET